MWKGADVPQNWKALTTLSRKAVLSLLLRGAVSVWMSQSAPLGLGVRVHKKGAALGK